MRDYARISPRFWVQGTGEKLRQSRSARTLALYLMSCPSSSMVGIYYLPIPTMAFELGFTEAEIRAALVALEELDFAHFDETDHLVYLPEGARYQVGETLKPKDNKRKAVVKELAKWKRHRFAHLFWDRYATSYHLESAIAGTPLEGVFDPSPTPCEGVPKGSVGSSGPLAQGSIPVPVPDPVGGLGENDAPARPATPKTGEPKADAIRAELDAHDAFAEIDRAEAASKILGYLAANGRALEWHIEAIRRSATKVDGGEIGGEPWKPSSIASYLLAATRNPSRPRKADEPDPEVVLDPTATKKSVDDWYARNTGGAS
jgi:hypothetical protein